ncbi:MAG: hypothetical protein Q7J86_05290 [Bacteroidota bacterium]|nr:hypothetical protein [Bacteroidota bacterium]
MNQRKQMKAKMNFEIEMFCTPACHGLSGRYGTLDMVVKIPVRHMNVTAKDNALISETDYL